MSEKKWLPLESNPDVMNDYVEKLGLRVETLRFVDVYGFDEDLLQMVPQPVHAVMLLYPITKENEEFGSTMAAAMGDHMPGDVFFMKQTVSNACGTIGILHALANNKEVIGTPAPGSFLEEFLAASATLDAAARAKLVESSAKLDAAQAEAAQQGQSRPPAPNEDVNLHFICFVSVGNVLYELDGRKPCPVPHGECPPEALLAASIDIIQQYMSFNPDLLNFAATALCTVPTD